jgi:glycosyltransferase involved in cell wall biosynthesis
MEKFSIIIPTIWKSEYTMELLERYSKSDYVGEIILIDNAPTKDIVMDKLVHIKEETNTYVNAAWNKGVSIAKYDYVTICNDDILFNPNEYFYYMSQALNLLDAGFIGSHSQNYTEDKIEVAIEMYDNKTNAGGWGCLFAFNKNIWKPIPERLKIWYGDNWIHGTNQNIFQLIGMNIKTKMSTSSDRMDVREVRDNDTKEWHKLLNNQ